MEVLISCWGRHLRPSTEGPRTIWMQRQGLLPARQTEQSKDLKLRAKKGEDQRAEGEDEGMRREAKTKAPKVKTKASKEW